MTTYKIKGRLFYATDVFLYLQDAPIYISTHNNTCYVYI